ncbi:hypothetical protein GCM10017600_60540 [Streptosporangium carneum]|uniref:Uncharacterized protein n=1 Tax=Streptosporangium carneum TaxID=47481 RepID=A0A9W6I7K8_9ACTN|nr:hypothetical protein GCM10017600_60540 [Streptosporangium carneum]
MSAATFDAMVTGGDGDAWLMWEHIQDDTRAVIGTLTDRRAQDRSDWRGSVKNLPATPGATGGRIRPPWRRHSRTGAAPAGTASRVFEDRRVWHHEAHGDGRRSEAGTRVGEPDAGTRAGRTLEDGDRDGGRALR